MTTEDRLLLLCVVMLLVSWLWARAAQKANAERREWYQRFWRGYCLHCDKRPSEQSHDPKCPVVTDGVSPWK